MRRIKKGEVWDEELWDKKFQKPKFEAKGFSWRHKDYVYIDRLFNISQFEGTLLDVGCAFGDGLLYFKRKCPNVTKFYGADISPEVIRICKEKQNLRDFSFFECEITKPLKGKYDIITCLQTIEHVKDPEKAILNLINSTRKLLIISVPFKNRRRGKSHLWYFEEDDFSELFDYTIFGMPRTKNGRFRNLYWVISKGEKNENSFIKSGSNQAL